MKRNCAIEDISDGNLYKKEDLVTVSCNGCKGNATCCRGMGASIILDPYDIYQLTIGLKVRFEELLADKIELNIVDGMILPNLKMADLTESCNFLNTEGRCSIHSIRPGICRLFPLGRYYEKHSFQYFLQINECSNQCKTMVKVSKWLGIPELNKYEEFVNAWHYFLKEMESYIKTATDVNLVKTLNMYILNTFFVRNYSTEDFYSQFYGRLAEAKKTLQLDV